MRRHKLLMTSLVALATCFAGAASAQTRPWMGGTMDRNLYIGANVGQSAYSKSCDSVPVDCDDKDTGCKRYRGIRSIATSRSKAAISISARRRRVV